MADNGYAKYSGFGGGSGSSAGVSSLNLLTGGLAIVAGTGITVTPVGSNITIAATATGAVTSVGLADSTGLFNITGSPVTSSGTLTLSSLKSQSANLFLASPNGSAGAPTFRAIVTADLPGGGVGLGTVTAVSVVNANGFNGTVATATSTPAITLTTTVTGVLKGNGTAISAATAGTDYVIPSGSITGTSANVTGSSNSTLTTLSALSLPIGQVTGTINATNLNGGLLGSMPYQSAVNTTALLAGNTTAVKQYLTQTGTGTVSAIPAWAAIAAADVPTLNQNTTGTAANITATTNSTLTTISTLTSVGTIATGTWNATAIGVTKGGTGLATLTANNVILGAGTSTPTFVAPSTSGNVLTSNGTTWVSQAAGGTSPTGSYAQAGFRGLSVQWSTASTVIVDPTNTGGNTLTVSASNGITLTAAASSVCGITFTPASATAVYMITANMAVSASPTAGFIGVLTNSAGTAFGSSGGTNSSQQYTIQGIFAPASASAQTVKVQCAVLGSGTTTIIQSFNSGLGSAVEWTVVRIL